MQKTLRSLMRYIHWIPLGIAGMTILPMYSLILVGFPLVIGYEFPWISTVRWIMLLVGYVAIRLRRQHSVAKFWKYTIECVAVTGAVMLGSMILLIFDFYYLFSPLCAFFFRTSHRYLLISGLVGGFSIAGLFVRESGRWARLCCWGLLTVTLTFPFLIGVHVPAASTALLSYTVVQVTSSSFLQGVVKRIHQMSENFPCRYELLGWQEDNRLIYQAQCEGDTHYWQATPVGFHAAHRQPLPTLPKRLRHPQLSWDTLSQLRETFQTPNFLMQDLTVSPDGWWLAFVTSHDYGPEDVIFMSPSETAEFYSLFPLQTVTLNDLLAEYHSSSQKPDARQRREHVLKILFDDWEKVLGWDISECDCFGFQIVGQDEVNGVRYVSGRGKCYLDSEWCNSCSEDELVGQDPQQKTAILYTVYDDRYGVLGTYSDLSQYFRSNSKGMEYLEKDN